MHDAIPRPAHVAIEHMVVQALQELPLQKSSSTMLTDIRALHLQCKRSKVSTLLHAAARRACLPDTCCQQCHCIVLASKQTRCMLLLSQVSCIY